MKFIAMKQTILFGNGINRLSGDKFDWKNLLSSNNEGDIIVNIDNIENPTHLYEAIFLNHNKVKESDFKIMLREKLEELELDKASKNIYRRLLEIDAHNYMTTNYDGQFEKVLKEDGFSIDDKRSSKSSNSVNAHRKYLYKKNNKSISFWPIHGDFKKIDTMTFGFNQYCSSVSTLCYYLEFGKTREKGYENRRELYGRNGFVSWLKTNNIQGHYSFIKYKIKKQEISSDTNFWAELFFLSDIHIFGLGLDLAEIDLWLLLTKRKRYMQQTDTKRFIKNEIFVYGYFSSEIIQMLKHYGVNTDNATCPEPTAEWENKYMEWLDEMQKNVESRKRF